MPPVEFVDLAQTKALEECTISEAGNEMRRVDRYESQERLDIEVVVVIVGDEDQVNRWQIGKGEPGLAHALRPNVAKWARALGIHGVRQDIEPGELN